jgi:CBS domain-containing protein
MNAQRGVERNRWLPVRAKAAISKLWDRANGQHKSDPKGARLVRDAMSRQVVTIEPDEPISGAAERLAEQEVGVLAVCGGDHRLSAVITDRDIVVRTLAQGLDPERLTAGECATKEPVTVSPSETLDQAARRMDEQQVRRLPVIQAGRLVGIVSQADLAANGAERQAGSMLAKMAQMAGDRRSARWLLRRSYREGEEWRPPHRGSVSSGRRLTAAGLPRTHYALTSLVETAPSVYLAGVVIGVVLAALALLQLGPFQ